MNQKLFSYWLLSGVIITHAILSGCDRSSDSGSAMEHDDVAATVSFLLTIDGGDDEKSASWPLNCPPETTVLGAMQRAQQAGLLKLTSSGNGEMAFVSAIDGVENEGGNGKHWIFYINGEIAKRGCGAVVIQPFDEIDWRFEVYANE